jgi:putative membrane-bound dehydrogenase-like protein
MPTSLSLRWLVGLLCLAVVGSAATISSNSCGAEDGVEFPQPFNTQDAKDVLVPPEKLVERMTAPAGFQISLFAAEPQVQQPVCLTTDRRGRLWVGEMYTYAESKMNFETKLRDRIVILEDEDHDGKCDKRTVFWDEGVRLTAVAVGNGGVWALCAPYLYFIPDANGDDVPDGPAVIKLDGWNDSAVRHNIVNGLTLGPDGWLYGRHGILATSVVGKPGTPESRRGRINCGIWRYHPVREEFEVVCHGTTNPWGFDFDQYGEMFFINTVIGHFWHVIPNAHYRRMYGEHFNPRAYGIIEQHADHFHWDTTEAWSDVRKGVTESTKKAGGGHAHVGLMIYQGDNWPAEYRGDVFTLNMHGLRVNRDKLHREGSGYVAKHADDFLFANNPWFRGIELLYGNDGGVYIADWADVGECHENDGVHRTSGRIYKVAYGKTNRPTVGDVSKLTSEQLAELTLHANDWYVRQARAVLQERAVAKADLTAAHRRLRDILATHTDVTRRLRAMWALFVSGGIQEHQLRELANDKSEYVRTWSIRLLGDDGVYTADDLPILKKLAATDPSPLVRLHLASALAKMSMPERLAIGGQLARHGEDAADHNLPLMIWYGIEPAVGELPLEAVSIAVNSKIPLLRQYIARRLAEDVESRPAPLAALLVNQTSDGTLASVQEVTLGLAEGLRGWRRAPRPANWEAFQKQWSARGDEALQTRLRELGAVFGDGRALDELRRIALDGNADGEARRAALRAIIESRPDDLAALLQKLLNDRSLVGVAARGLAAVGDPNTPRFLLDRWQTLSAEDQRGALETLVSRPTYALALLDAIESGRLRRTDVSAWHARQIRGFDDSKLNEKLGKLWGEVRESPEEAQRQVAQLRTQLTPEFLAKANLEIGRQLFEKSCGNCHALFGKGAAIGPDLTGANRGNLQYVLENVIDPSASVATDFRSSTVLLHDGRTLNGVVSYPTPRTVAIQTATEKLTVPKDEVEQIKATNLSLMPNGLLTPLTPEQVRDLIGYVMTRPPGAK